MPTTIERELKKSNDYMLTRTIDKTKNLLDLTFDNVCRVEAMIKENRSYRRAQDPNAKPKNKKDHGSSAYWFRLLFEQLQNGKPQNGDNCQKLVADLVAALDSENSTHLNTRKEKDSLKRRGRGVMTERVLRLLANFDSFTDRLRNSDRTLIQTLACPDESYAGKELAFASKFCHYAAFWLFKEENEADNYSIFDSIVSKALVNYAEKYLGKEYEVQIEKYKQELRKVISKSKKIDWATYRYDDFYEHYQELIDATRKKASIRHGGDMISRNGFDHLLWYAS